MDDDLQFDKIIEKQHEHVHAAKKEKEVVNVARSEEKGPLDSPDK